MDQKQPANENIAKIAKLIKGIRFAMMTTVTPDGKLHSRPMTPQEQEFDGDLWFFSPKDTLKVDEIAADSRVNLAFSNPDDNSYVSIFGKASLVSDRAKIHELWSPALKAWFPDGPDDPSIILVKVDPESAQYWDAPSSKLVELAGFAKALITGERYNEAGDSGTVKL